MADTAAYYHAAYAVAGVLYALYAVSLVRRRRRVLARLAALDEATAGPPPSVPLSAPLGVPPSASR